MHMNYVKSCIYILQNEYSLCKMMQIWTIDFVYIMWHYKVIKNVV